MDAHGIIARASRIAQEVIAAYGGADQINTEMDDSTFDAATVERLIREGVQVAIVERINEEREAGVTLTYAGYGDVWDAQRQRWISRRRGAVARSDGTGAPRVHRES